MAYYSSQNDSFALDVVNIILMLFSIGVMIYLFVAFFNLRGKVKNKSGNGKK